MLPVESVVVRTQALDPWRCARRDRSGSQVRRHDGGAIVDGALHRPRLGFELDTLGGVLARCRACTAAALRDVGEFVGQHRTRRPFVVRAEFGGQVDGVAVGEGDCPHRGGTPGHLG